MVKSRRTDIACCGLESKFGQVGARESGSNTRQYSYHLYALGHGIESDKAQSNAQENPKDQGRYKAEVQRHQAQAKGENTYLLSHRELFPHPDSNFR